MTPSTRGVDALTGRALADVVLSLMRELRACPTAVAWVGDFFDAMPDEDATVEALLSAMAEHEPSYDRGVMWLCWFAAHTGAAGTCFCGGDATEVPFGELERWFVLAVLECRVEMPSEVKR